MTEEGLKSCTQQDRWSAEDRELLNGACRDGAAVALRYPSAADALAAESAAHPDWAAWLWPRWARAGRPLPAGLSIGGDLYLRDCPGLTSLPAGLSVGGSLDLSGCPGLTSLPAGLRVGGRLALAGCPGLTSLPAGLSVGGDLYLRGCPGLGVDGRLALAGCPGLTSLPAGLKGVRHTPSR